MFEQGTYDIILGMDWLGRYHAEILCKEKIVQVKKGYLCFIASNEEKTKLSLEKTLINCEYPDVFPEDLLGYPQVKRLTSILI